jgi:hydrogenase/urease accessory protein HupE
LPPGERRAKALLGTVNDPAERSKGRRSGADLRVAIAVGFAMALMAWTTPAGAHEVGLSRGTYAIEGDHLRAELVLSRREVASLVPDLDADKDGQLIDAEIVAARPVVQRAIVDRIRVASGEATCPGVLEEASLAEQDGILLRAMYTCPGPITHARLDFAVLGDLAPGHRHIARATGGVQVEETVISRAQRTFDIDAVPAGFQPRPVKRDRLSLLGLGVEHILTGYDHLVFLLGLVLVGGRWRSLLWVVTAFTVAHSITLGLAALGVWAPRPAIIEPAIALSIAYVGVENFFVKNAEKRWRITFPFGLVHGFGFAGALREVALPKADVPAALFLFNAGVEIGQLAVLALVLPALVLLRRWSWFDKHGVRVVSGAIVIAGLVWFVARVVSAQ